MTDSLLSSGELSDLSDNGIEKITITPICPVCRKNYSDKVKPISIQPCGHGICSICLNTLKEYVTHEVDENGNPTLEETPVKCPTCRQTIIHHRPNFDLREITRNVNIDHISGYWERQIIQMCELKGIRIKFSKAVRKYAKPICMRIAYNDTFVKMTDTPVLWTASERGAVMIMKNSLRYHH